MRPFACDGILIQNNKLLLIRRGKEPFKGEWALPGGRINDHETAEECLKREMKEETGLEIEPITLVGIYSDPGRDPRRIITAAYLVRLISGNAKGGDDAAEAKWFDLDALPPLCADHPKIVKDSIVIFNKCKIS
ncbi:NUDIX hydrolase [Candidatus Micrarchaeota archaeon]|nr:NUDIX hydrolase [Candidatus Micrarchaeota archaeon]